VSAGGGGFGKPLSRTPEHVLEDVLDDKVSQAAAESLYGVVIRNGLIDRAATDRLRGSMAHD
jgi:N-methylhydantoinase B